MPESKKYFLAIFTVVIATITFWGCFQPSYIRRVNLIHLGSGAKDTDGIENIFWGIPESDADTVINRIGYSLGYSYKLKLAVWVSYYSRQEWVKSRQLTGRHWSEDTSLPQGTYATLDDYYKSGYDRGHLAMQADMRGRSGECEREACLLSNVAPQKPEFNRGIWNILEEKIRDYVEEDGDCWIVDGPVFYSDEYETIGDNKIPVPDAFYKIVIDTADGNVFAYSFIIPNKDSDLPLDSFAVSIDSIEFVTDIDFFNELPDNVEKELESQKNLIGNKIVRMDNNL
ncbi:DNA/RNA non-specific endonuclease [bacterium]|nr:DNA/RNA non-specific endonuclease [bacterium]